MSIQSFLKTGVNFRKLPRPELDHPTSIGRDTWSEDSRSSSDFGTETFASQFILVACLAICVGSSCKPNQKGNASSQNPKTKNAQIVNVENSDHRFHSPKHSKVREAVQLSLRGNITGAIEMVSQVIKTQPTGEAFYNRGMFYLSRNEYDPAILDLQEALKRDPSLIDAHFQLATAFILTGKLQEAEQHATLSLAKRPDDPDALFNRGRAYYGMKNFVAAEKDFLASLRLKPSQDHVHYSLGHLYSVQDMWKQAIVHYTHSISLNPGNGRAFKFRGKAHEALGNKAEAKKDFLSAAQRGIASN